MAQFLDKAGALVIVDKINSLHADQETANELISGKVTAIEGKIPTAASSSNQLADKEFVASTYIPASAKGAKGGVATLDTNGKIPNGQLPSYVDDVLEYADRDSFPKSGEDGKIYVAEDTNITYRWGGTAYVEISSSLALGETAQTAYAGDKGKANADAIAALQTRATNIESKNTTQDTAISKAQTTANNAVKKAGDLMTGNLTVLSGDSNGAGDITLNASNAPNANMHGVIVASLESEMQTSAAGKTIYSYNKIARAPLIGNSATYVLTLPSKTGTLAVTTDIPSSLPPSGSAGGDLTGSYPSPTIANGKITKAKCDSGVQASLGKADTAVQPDALNNYVDITSDQVIGGSKHFSSGINVVMGVAVDNDADNAAVYNSNGILFMPTGSIPDDRINGDDETAAHLSFPSKSGTFALLSDITWANLSGKPTIPAVDTAIPATEISAMFDF